MNFAMILTAAAGASAVELMEALAIVLAVGKRDHRLLQLQRAAAAHFPPNRDAGARAVSGKPVSEQKPAHGTSVTRVTDNGNTCP